MIGLPHIVPPVLYFQSVDPIVPVGGADGTVLTGGRVVVGEVVGDDVGAADGVDGETVGSEEGFVVGDAVGEVGARVVVGTTVGLLVVGC